MATLFVRFFPHSFPTFPFLLFLWLVFPTPSMEAHMVLAVACAAAAKKRRVSYDAAKIKIATDQGRHLGVAVASRNLGVPENTVRNWVEFWKQEKKYYEPSTRGRKPFLNAEQVPPFFTSQVFCVLFGMRCLHARAPSTSLAPSRWATVSAELPRTYFVRCVPTPCEACLPDHTAVWCMCL